MLLLAAAVVPVGAQGALPAELTTFCQSGMTAGKCGGPSGVAVDPVSGNVFVADGGETRRIHEFTAWGEPVRAWGWGVVASGPNDDPRNEIQELSVDATAGSFALNYLGPTPSNTTGPIPFNASAETVEAALQAAGKPITAKIIGPDGGPWTIEYLGDLADTEISNRLSGNDTPTIVNSTLSGGTGASIEETQKGANFEVCVPAEEDVCRAAQSSHAPGALVGPQGIARGSGGGLYVYDTKTLRLQKYDLSGSKPTFAWMVGGGVNQGPSNPGNLCTAADLAGGDSCAGGSPGTGAGAFTLPGGQTSNVAVAGQGTDTEADDVVYVGDANRIQKFDADGGYLGEIPFTGAPLPEPGFAAALAVDQQSGDLYFAYQPTFVGNQPVQPGIHRIDPVSGEEQDILNAQTASALAVSAEDHVYAFRTPNNPNQPKPFTAAILEFDAEGSLVESTDAAAAGLGVSARLAASSACGIEGTDLFVANSAPSFVRIYGPPPQQLDDPCSPPPARAPEITKQYALSVGSEGASLQAEIDPRFWPDTRYYVQYGTGECSKGGCEESVPAPPGLLLTDQIVEAPLTSKSVFLEGLEPGTTYHFRFVAESSGGGPTYGIDPDGEGPQEASEAEGLERSFTTYPSPPGGGDDPCPNRSFRTGLAASLPDCRAYELVSPLDKDNGDVGNDENVAIAPTGNFEAAAVDGERATYSSYRAFASPEAAPLISQYISSRGPEGWLTHSISPPRSPVPFYEPGAHPSNVQFKAFSEDLCGGWLIQDSDVALVPGAPSPTPAFYHRDDRDCGGESYELFTPVGPPGFEPGTEGSESHYYLELQGVSDDGETALLRTDDALTDDACKVTIEEKGVDEGKGIFQLYLQEAGAAAPALVSVLPSGAPACVHSSAGTHQSDAPGTSIGDNVLRALAADGSRAFWSSSASSANQNPVTGGAGDQPGPLYVRLNPAEMPSPTAFGGATGSGDLGASGTGIVGNNSETVSSVETKSGEFVIGQTISDSEGAIPAGTTIVAIEEFPVGTGKLRLTLSAKATKAKVGAALSAIGSPFVTGVKTSFGAFAAGQSIAGSGIPPGTTIEAVAEPEPGVFKLTLSANTTQAVSGATLEAWSECTEADVKACTVPISAASSARFWGADPQGNHAIYTAGGALLEYDVETGTNTTIAPSGVVAVMGASTDLSRVYFLSSADLTGAQENSEHDVATAGQPNLYLHERGAGTVFVGTLAQIDTATTTTLSTSPTPASFLPYRRTSRVSADGLHAAFTSTAQLTGYDNTDVASGKSDAEVFLYDAAPSGSVGELACISCNPTGAQPRGALVREWGVPVSKDSLWAAGWLPGWENQFAPTRALSADGNRVFFESFENLVLRDANNKRDVYEWQRAANAEECEKAGGELHVPAAAGCISLISSGTSSVGSEFLDASSSGEDVFFTTAASLLDHDTGFVDVYDARVGGGLPGPPVEGEGCEGEACQPPGVAPDTATPATSAEGVGNPAPPPRSCARQARRARRAAARLRAVMRRSDAAHLRRRAARSARRAARQARLCRTQASREAAR